MAVLAPSVQAATFTLTGGKTPFTFWIPDSPTPDVYYQGVSFVIYDVPAPSASGLVDVTFYNKDWFDQDMRSLQIEDYTANVQLYELFGPQLYSKAEAAPTFLGGTYQLRDIGGKIYNLTITTDVVAIPEPASWALMIAGFGAVGLVTRRRPTISMAYRIA
jgi:hypothetical protein